MTENVESTHPLYDKLLYSWTVMNDTYDGEEAIKTKGTEYLPATAGMIAFGAGKGDEQLGERMYQAYKFRALFPDVVADAVRALMGIMHRKPPDIRLPAKMKSMLEKATLEGETMHMLLRRINTEQLVTGRVGLMLDLPSEPTTNGIPYLALYSAKEVINWDDGSRLRPVPQSLNLVVLDESESVRVDGFQWSAQQKYRILFLGDLEENEAKGVYQVQLVNKSTDEEELFIPNYRSTRLDKIPFVFVNASDLVPEPEMPPLMGLAYLALAIYRGEADHRQALFMQGQDTLVVIGGEDDKVYMTGAGGTITPPLGGDAKFIGVQSGGLGEMRHQLENDKKIAAQKAAQMTDTTSRQRESGDALRVRVAAQTATLHQIAQTGAEGLQQILRIAAEWMGEDPAQVEVIPNTDYSAEMLDGKTLRDWVEAQVLGLPWSKMSMHKVLKQGGLTEMSFEEETAQLEVEQEERLAQVAKEEAMGGSQQNQ